MFALGVSRFISCAHWVLQLLGGDTFVFRAFGMGVWPACVLLSEVVQTFILADFWCVIFSNPCVCAMTFLRQSEKGGADAHPCIAPDAWHPALLTPQHPPPQKPHQQLLLCQVVRRGHRRHPPARGHRLGAGATVSFDMPCGIMAGPMAQLAKHQLDLC